MLIFKLSVTQTCAHTGVGSMQLERGEEFFCKHLFKPISKRPSFNYGTGKLVVNFTLHISVRDVTRDGSTGSRRHTGRSAPSSTPKKNGHGGAGKWRR